MSDLLTWMLGAPPPKVPFDSLEGFWASSRPHRERWGRSVERAVAAGFVADRLGTAFLGGYHGALTALVPQAEPASLVALCATEEAGAHPRAIHTRLTRGPKGWLLEGTKQWVTGGPLAQSLLVVASAGTDELGRSRLRVVRVAAGAPGVDVEPMPQTPFVPEIPHATIALRGVQVPDEALLEGDGYDRYLKPFRTLEDLHVHAALLGYLYGVACRFEWPEELRELLVGSLTCALALGECEPGRAVTHVQLAGLLGWGRRALAEASPHWERVEEEERRRFERDRPLFGVAAKAREARRRKAWDTLAGPT